jgi:hypothetical protein
MSANVPSFACNIIFKFLRVPVKVLCVVFRVNRGDSGPAIWGFVKGTTFGFGVDSLGLGGLGWFEV